MFKKLLGILAMFSILCVPTAYAVTYTIDHIDDVSIVLNGSPLPSQFQSALGSKTVIRIAQTNTTNYLVLPLAQAQALKLSGSQCLAFVQRSQGANLWLTSNLASGTVVTPVFATFETAANMVSSNGIVYIGDVLVNGVSVKQSLIAQHLDSPLSNQFTTCL